MDRGKKGRQKKNWMANKSDWTGKRDSDLVRTAENRAAWSMRDFFSAASLPWFLHDHPAKCDPLLTRYACLAPRVVSGTNVDILRLTYIKRRSHSLVIYYTSSHVRPSAAPARPPLRLASLAVLACGERSHLSENLSRTSMYHPTKFHIDPSSSLGVTHDHLLTRGSTARRTRGSAARRTYRKIFPVLQCITLQNFILIRPVV